MKYTIEEAKSEILDYLTSESKKNTDAYGRPCISREQFISNHLSERDYKNRMSVLDQAMKSLVISGYLLTCKKSGDFTFFRHRGRQFPKLWIIRKDGCL